MGSHNKEIGIKGAECLVNAIVKNNRIKKLSGISLQELNNIVEVDLNSQGYGVIEAFVFAILLEGNAKIKDLDISNNNISDAGAQKIANLLKANSGLKKLNISQNNITDCGAHSIADALRARKVNDIVYIIDETKKKIDIGDWIYVEHALGKGTRVLAPWKTGPKIKKYFGTIEKKNSDKTFLILFDDGSKISCKEYELIPVDNKEYARIEKIGDVKYSIRFENGKQSTSCGIHQINKHCYQRGKIKTVDDTGSYTILFDDDKKDHDKFNHTLTELDISNNQITDVGAKSFAKTLSANSVLKILSLYANQIGDLGAKAIADVLILNSTLKILDLENNKIGNDGLDSIVTALKSNTTLQNLYMLYNKYNEKGIRNYENVRKDHISITNIELCW